MSAAHPTDRLAEHALGLLDASERGEVEAHVATCASCAAEAARAADLWAELALALPPSPPPPELRERVLAATREGASKGRFARFVDDVARLLDQSREVAAGLVDRIDVPASWEPGPGPGIQLFHLPPGPALAGSLAGFVLVPQGGTFPLHRHLGDEQVLVLQGSFRDDDGSLVARGMTAKMPGGSQHSFTALPGPDLIYLVVLVTGVEIPGVGTIQV